MEIYDVFLLLSIGAFVGFAAGMFGIGGGGILVPLLTHIFLSRDLNQEIVVHLALGTSMCIIIMTTYSSFMAQHKKGFVQWQIFKLIAPGVLIGTFLGTFIAARISSVYLAIIFSIFMFYSSMKMFFSSPAASAKENLQAKYQFLAGCGIGSLSSLVSIGGGILSVPFLTWQGIDVKKAIATSSAIGFVLAVSGTMGYVINGWGVTNFENFTFGFIDLKAAFFVAIASYFAAPLGVKMMHKLPSEKLKKLFAILPFVLSIKMLYNLL